MQIFDAHFHVIDPEFPVYENNGFTPDFFTANDYLKRTENLEIKGGTIVSGSFQKFDQEYLIASLKTLGSNFFGVANIPFNISDEEILRLKNNNIVAVRFNLKRGGSEKIDYLVNLSNKLFEEHQFHTELYIDSKDLPELKNILKQIPVFSIDHLGLSKEGFKDVLYWTEKGVKIKATGFGRIDFDPIEGMKQIYSVNENALMFGTDLPSTRAKTPFQHTDIDLIKGNFTVEEAEKILHTNGLNWYKQNI